MDTTVALINMPFSELHRPSLGLSLLKAGLSRRGVDSRIHYLNLSFAEHIDHQLFAEICFELSPQALTGEWLFAAALWGDDPAADRAYVRQVLEGGSEHHRSWNGSSEQPVELIDRLLSAREHVETFLDRCLEKIPWERYKIVGFSSVFEQQVASLALAKRLKERYPDLFILLGGANCEGPMGVALLKGFPFLDAVCIGEGDVAFPELVSRRLADEPIGELPGIVHRATDGLMRDKPADIALRLATSPLRDLDALPHPDYDDYFTDLEQASFSRELTPILMFETSRGCWWGEKSHCTFCGLNGLTMKFREKSADRALAEISELIERYGQHTRVLNAVDNIIPMSYFKTLLPRLRDLAIELELFYETKANLRKDQIELYSAVGLKKIQPGIESFSTPVLKLMQKGITGLQNIRLLKWCRQFGVKAIWNYLAGLPGERAEDYELAETVRSIFHLQPPNDPGMERVRFDRFSPYFSHPESFGIADLQPYPAYSFVYRGLDEETLMDLAYYFVGDYDEKPRVAGYTEDLRLAIDHWLRDGQQSALFSVAREGVTEVWDFRPDAVDSLTILNGPQRAINEICDDITAKKNLRNRLASALEREVSEDELDEHLRPLLQKRFLLQEDDKFLSLVVPAGKDFHPDKLTHTAQQEAPAIVPY